MRAEELIRAEVVSVPGELVVHWGERTSQPRSPMVTDYDTCAKGMNRPRVPGNWAPGDGLAQEGILEEETPAGT